MLPKVVPDSMNSACNKGREIADTVSNILNHAIDRPDSLMFLFFVAATDESKKVFNFLKTKMNKVAKITKELNYKILEASKLREVIENDRTQLLLDSEPLIEKTIVHCILLKSIPCLEYVMCLSKKLCLNTSINISTVCTLIEEYEDKIIQKIIKLLMSKSLILNFASQRDKKLERMSSDFKLHSQNDVSAGGSFYEEVTPRKMNEVSKLKDIDEENSVSFHSKESEDSFRKQEEEKLIRELDEDIGSQFEGGSNEEEVDKKQNLLNMRSEKRDSSSSRHRTDDQETIHDEKHNTLRQISELLARRKLEGYLSSKDMNIFPLNKKTKNKFFQPKDYVEIAIRYCLMSDDEILNFINFLFFEDLDELD